MSFLFSSFKQPHFEADACRGEVSIQNGSFNKILIRFTSPSRMVAVFRSIGFPCVSADRGIVSGRDCLLESCVRSRTAETVAICVSPAGTGWCCSHEIKTFRAIEPTQKLSPHCAFCFSEHPATDPIVSFPSE